MVDAEFRVRQKPRVFFSYSYRDDQILRPIFLEASIESDVTPLFADEYMEVGDNILKKIQHLMISSDVCVIDISNHNYNVFTELIFAEMLNKPFFIISKKYFRKRPPINFHLNKYMIRFYENVNNLKEILIGFFNDFKRDFKDKDNLIKIAKEDNLIDIIKRDMEKKVMILGKDSDAAGIAKINRIKTIVTNQGYEPVIMRDLPNIKEISFARARDS